MFRYLSAVSVLPTADDSWHASSLEKQQPYWRRKLNNVLPWADKRHFLNLATKKSLLSECSTCLPTAKSSMQPLIEHNSSAAYTETVIVVWLQLVRGCTVRAEPLLISAKVQILIATCWRFFVASQPEACRQHDNGRWTLQHVGFSVSLLPSKGSQ